MRVRFTEEFRFPADIHVSPSTFVAPGEYTVRAEPGEGYVTKELAEAALAAQKAEDITNQGKAAKE